MPHSNLLTTLNQAQKNAVTYTDTPLLIIAGAGTGKTTVITQKIGYLIDKKLALPHEILAVTFTEKAAQEMEERVDKILPYGIFDKWISTFHSFCQRILENHSLDIGISPDFRLIDTTESWLVIRKNLYKFSLDYYRPKGNPTKFIHALLSHFSRLKDENISAEEYLVYAQGLEANTDTTMGDASTNLDIKRIKEIAEAYFQYQQLLLDQNLLDFGDLIFFTNKLFVQRPNILKKYQNQFKYILVDEFQDTNYAQYQLIKHLSKQSRVMVVGDDDQAIYKFRGASVSNILNFKNDYSDATEIVLTENYRSTQNILDMAYSFIQYNNPDRLEHQLQNPDKYYKNRITIKTERLSKHLKSQTIEIGTIELIHAKTEGEEVACIINKIQKLIETGASFNDIAILVRAHYTAEPFIEALKRADMPYVYLSNTGLYTEDIILNLLSYLRVLTDRTDAPSLNRILSSPIGQIQTDELIAINSYAKQKSRPLFQTLEKIQELDSTFNQETKIKIEKLISLIKTHTDNAKKQSSLELIFKILHDTRYTAYLTHLEQRDPHQAAPHIYALNQFLYKVEQYRRSYHDTTMTGFIEHINLEREAGDRGVFDQNILDQGPEAIKVLTIHASKGLEFSYVFIPKLVEQRFPTVSRNDLIEIPQELITTREILPEGDEHLEEERRLFYVALTRAKHGLFVSYADNYGGKRTKKPSRFLFESRLLTSANSLPADTKAPLLFECIEKGTVRTPQHNKTVPLLPLPKEFSYSQLVAFKTCPLQYKYQFILKIPQDKGKQSLSFGRTMHSTMQEIFKRVQMRHMSSQPTLFGKETPLHVEKNELISLDEIYDIYHKAWIDDWYESEENKQHYYKSGKKILNEFFELNKNNWGTPWFLEKSFKIKLGDITLKGRVDRIDKIQDNSKNSCQSVEIIDYKTGKFKDKLEQNDKEQLLIYQLALEEQGLHPVALKYYFLHEDRQGVREFLGTSKELKQLRNDLSETIAEIKMSNFPAKPNRHHCSFCDFKNICPFSAV